MLFELLDKKLIEHPYQVAIGKINTKDKTGKYEYFSTDAFPILNYMHPVLEASKVYEDELEILTNVARRQIINNSIFSSIDKKQQMIKLNYERIRCICTPNSVSNDFFIDCLKHNKSHVGKNLTGTILSYLSNEAPEYKLLCDLEKALFLWGNNSYYLCTFYNYKDYTDAEAYIFIVFCQQRHSTIIAEIVRSAISKSTDAELLENIDEHYQSYIKQESIKEANVIDWVTKLESQLNENIKNNSTVALNREGWNSAFNLFNEKKKFVTELNGESLFRMAESAHSSDFMKEINKLK
ncbi:MAG: hypothetical protein JNL69_00020 [Bacteroidia bacterium]|nr:hypothetical protein [Bacteroidia bacterium]